MTLSSSARVRQELEHDPLEGLRSLKIRKVAGVRDDL
jgi:hypothetical protein